MHVDLMPSESAEAMEEALQDVIMSSADLYELGEGANLLRVTTFGAEGYLTRDRGLRLVFENGATFDLTIHQTSAPGERLPL